MEKVLTILTDGFIYSSWLFLVALGLTIIFGVLRILNIAHGSFYAFGAYVGAWLVTQFFGRHDPVIWALFLLFAGAIVIGLIIGWVIERGILRWVYDKDPVTILLITFALLLIFEDTIKLIWGVDPYYAFQPYARMGTINIAGIAYAGYSFLLIAMSVIIGLGSWLALNKTRLGKMIVAVIQDREISQAMGINVTALCTLTFLCGTAIASLGGAFTAPMISVVPGIAIEVIVLSFAVVVIGGLGSLGGAAFGALCVGMVRAAAVHLIPELEVFMVYLVMALVLLVRPFGLFGKVEIRRI